MKNTLHPQKQRSWLGRVCHSVWLAAIIMVASLTGGVLGYHFLGQLNWVDSLLEASMILGGMGPVAVMSNNEVKIFASIYALFSGLVILTTSGIILAPWLHRLMYHTHRQARRDAIAEEKD